MVARHVAQHVSHISHLLLVSGLLSYERRLSIRACDKLHHRLACFVVDEESMVLVWVLTHLPGRHTASLGHCLARALLLALFNALLMILVDLGQTLT